ncbi:hypothetical protein AGMMS49950_07740 [Endomicrobiia bacterium]|nr:hypothetical protein AGMMS49531_08540 [Endomicrobiia bacterium]GHT71319.1 hypothetical protein AGMMS49950_07740 [Endomicrobiia bacterium]
MKKATLVLLLLCIIAPCANAYTCMEYLFYYSDNRCCPSGTSHGLKCCSLDAHCCDCECCRSKSQKIFVEQGKALANAARRQILRVKVLNARFYKQYTTDTLPISMAEITIENKSDHPIKTIFFNGKLVTHKTRRVLIDDAFRYDIDGALASKETNTYNIPLNSYGKWATARPPDLAKFDVAITGIEISDAVVLIPFQMKIEKK